MAILAVGMAKLYGQSDIIPQEIITTGESFREFILGEFALIILGIIWAGACLAFAFNKDSQRAKIGFIAVTISCIALGLTQTIINQFVSMGN